MRIDAHHHCWQLDRFNYPWMTPDLKPLLRNFGPGDLHPLLAIQRFDRSVLVQTISSLDETRWFLELAERHDWIAGVVGWVDLTDPTLDNTLDELQRHPKFVGVRHQVHDEPDPRWLVRDDVLGGLARLAGRAIPYDLLVRPQHLPAAIEVARRLPELSLVIDHVAKPAITSGGWDDWAAPFAELAAHPNVSCKLSGMITEADWQRWQPSDLRPYLEHALDCFTPERLMFGSDWPVCLLAGSYAQVVAALEKNLAALPAAQQAAVFGGTAVRVYGLA
ncbi:MAG: amidohydrolase family protein [Pirellulales bacterium]